MKQQIISYLALAVSIVSALIAGFALHYSNKNASDRLKVTEIHNKLAVSPRLVSVAIFDSTQKFSGFGFSNNGLGPAIVHNVSYSVDGYKINGSASEAMMNIVQELDLNSKLTAISPAKKGAIIKADDTIWLFRSRGNSVRQSRNMLELYKRINVSVCYCSVYDECQTKNIGRPIKQELKCKKL